MKRSRNEFNHAQTTLLVASFGGACGFIAVETTFADLMESSGRRLNTLAEWQLHMGSACVGITTFFAFLFLLEVLETRSKATAWRSSWPWLPLIGLTGFATAIHIPFYVVALTSTLYSVWAYRRTRSVRG